MQTAHTRGERSFGFVRVAAVSPWVSLGTLPVDGTYPHSGMTENVAEMLRIAQELEKQGVQLAVYPELGITGYSRKDGFKDLLLLDEAREEFLDYVLQTRTMELISVVGFPLALANATWNVGAVVCRGEILGLIPKAYIPSGNEFEERRWFSPAGDLHETEVRIPGYTKTVPIGTDLVFSVLDDDREIYRFGVGVCEDDWHGYRPAVRHTANGAVINVNVSASPEIVGKASYRRQMCRAISGDSIGAYIYASAGMGESSQGVAFGGHLLITENGSLVKESGICKMEGHFIVADVDVEKLQRERRATPGHGDATSAFLRDLGGAGQDRVIELRQQEFDLCEQNVPLLMRHIDPRPFVPSNPATLDARCEEIFTIVKAALKRRLLHVGRGQPFDAYLGLSGGLDSTLAAIFTREAMLDLGWDPAEFFHMISMRGFGTGRQTRANVRAMGKAWGMPIEWISISGMARKMIRAQGHEPCENCLMCENTQARIRTDILMNKGFTIGTGDLSEGVLGFCTFGADQLSMYNPNGGIPKTLVQHLVRWHAMRSENAAERRALLKVLATKISPELTRDEQNTEDIIGPYLLHDFFIYWSLRHGAAPRKIFFLWQQVRQHLEPHEAYDDSTTLKWMRRFYERFHGGASQFKRDSLPNSPKVGTISIDPRGDHRWPSDSTASLWLSEVDEMIARQSV